MLESLCRGPTLSRLETAISFLRLYDAYSFTYSGQFESIFIGHMEDALGNLWLLEVVAVVESS